MWFYRSWSHSWEFLWKRSIKILKVLYLPLNSPQRDLFCVCQCNTNTDCILSFLNNSRVKPLIIFWRQAQIAEVINQILELLWKLGHRHVSTSLWIRKTVYFLKANSWGNYLAGAGKKTKTLLKHWSFTCWQVNDTDIPSDVSWFNWWGTGLHTFLLAIQSVSRSRECLQIHKI